MILNFQTVKFLSGRTEDSPTHRSITLSNIEEVKPYRKKEYYFLRIRTLKQEDIDLKFLNKDICKEWIGYLHQAMAYHEYLKER